jgi:hypothetical protein
MSEGSEAEKHLQKRDWSCIFHYLDSIKESTGLECISPSNSKYSYVTISNAGVKIEFGFAWSFKIHAYKVLQMFAKGQ